MKRVNFKSFADVRFGNFADASVTRTESREDCAVASLASRVRIHFGPSASRGSLTARARARALSAARNKTPPLFFLFFFIESHGECRRDPRFARSLFLSSTYLGRVLGFLRSQFFCGVLRAFGHGSASGGGCARTNRPHQTLARGVPFEDEKLDVARFDLSSL